MPVLALDLAVSPAVAVAHAAEQFSDQPGAACRFRAHAEPCCFYLDARKPGGSTSAWFVLLRRDRDGARLELVPTASGARLLQLFAGVLALVGAWQRVDWFALLAIVPVLFLALACEAYVRRAEQAEVVAALVTAFEPLRRRGLPYREH